MSKRSLILITAVTLFLIADHIFKIYLLATSRAIINQQTALVNLTLPLWAGPVLFFALGILWHWRPITLWLIIGLAGAANLIDRWRFGGVIDYLTLGPLMLNIADIIIVMAVGCLIINLTAKPKQK